jgi:diketogulonate reductase-like aldo/keto reductase
MLRPEFYVVLFLFRFHASLLFLRKHHTLLAVWEDGGNLTLTLMQGKIFDIPLLAEIATKYKRTIAQIVLRWNIQMGVVTIPKSIPLLSHRIMIKEKKCY